MDQGSSDWDAQSSIDAMRALADDPLSDQGTKKRIAIATMDIAGPIKHGGIGSAYTHAARFLAAHGHDVTVLFVHKSAQDEKKMAEVADSYAEFGVTFEGVTPVFPSTQEFSTLISPGYSLLERLRREKEPFDIVHCSEWRALGYFCLLAKSLGTDFSDTHFVVKGSSPTLWNAEGNWQFVRQESDLGLVFMERRCVELADTFIAGSAHLIDWMRQANYKMPERSFVWPNIYYGKTSPIQQTVSRLEEVVFFGRLEPRKGLVHFVDALSLLARNGELPPRVTFMGRTAHRFDGVSFIKQSSVDWNAEVKIETSFGSEQAIDYLREPGRLAVLPSVLENSSMAIYECLQNGVPFLTANTGGSPELVAQEDADIAITDINHIAIAKKIRKLQNIGVQPIRPRWNHRGAHVVWARWHESAAAIEESRDRFRKNAARVRKATPLVSVCIAHYERPRIVEQAIDSVRRQDWPEIELILVDDGSQKPETLAALDAYEPEFQNRGWRIIRQENRYSGAARNTAALEAQGEYLLFLDDDNVLMDNAALKLVEAAMFGDLDCVTAGGQRFYGEGDPRLGDCQFGTPLRFMGAARAWCMYRNVVGDACALVNRASFMKLGGYSEHYRIGLEDLEFYNRIIMADLKIEHLPEQVFFYRLSEDTMKKRNRSYEQGRFRSVAPYLCHGDAEDRALLSYAGSLHLRAAKPISSLTPLRVRERLWKALSANTAK